MLGILPNESQPHGQIQLLARPATQVLRQNAVSLPRLHENIVALQPSDDPPPSAFRHTREELGSVSEHLRLPLRLVYAACLVQQRAAKRQDSPFLSSLIDPGQDRFLTKPGAGTLLAPAQGRGPFFQPSSLGPCPAQFFLDTFKFFKRFPVGLGIKRLDILRFGIVSLPQYQASVPTHREAVFAGQTPPLS